jgi:hypothetical protein
MAFNQPAATQQQQGQPGTGQFNIPGFSNLTRLPGLPQSFGNPQAQSNLPFQITSRFTDVGQPSTGFEGGFATPETGQGLANPITGEEFTNFGQDLQNRGISEQQISQRSQLLDAILGPGQGQLIGNLLRTALGGGLSGQQGAAATNQILSGNNRLGEFLNLISSTGGIGNII